MSQVAFEALLRSHYRGTKGKELKKRKDVSLFDLVEEAEEDGLISPDEKDALHKMRKDYRIPYEHPDDFDESAGFSKPSFATQAYKIFFAFAGLRGYKTDGVEDEARETIGLLVTLFPKLSHRLLEMDVKAVNAVLASQCNSGE